MEEVSVNSDSPVLPTSNDPVSNQKAEEKEFFSIEKLGSLLPLLSALILIMGITNQTLFYGRFNVPIKYYLSFSEIGMLIAGDLLFLLLVCFVLGYGSLLHSDVFKKKRTALSQKYSLLIPIIFIILSLAIMIGRYFSKSYSWNLRFDAILYLLMFISLMQTDYVRKFLKSIEVYYLIFAIVNIFSYEVNATAKEIENIEGGKYTGTMIVTSDSTFTSTDSSFYIGQTDKAVFFYDIKTNQTTIVPTSEVKKTILVTNK